MHLPAVADHRAKPAHRARDGVCLTADACDAPRYSARVGRAEHVSPPIHGHAEPGRRAGDRAQVRKGPGIDLGEVERPRRRAGASSRSGPAREPEREHREQPDPDRAPPRDGRAARGGALLRSARARRGRRGAANREAARGHTLMDRSRSASRRCRRGLRSYWPAVSLGPGWAFPLTSIVLAGPYTGVNPAPERC